MFAALPSNCGMDTLLQDVRYGLRTLIRQPGRAFTRQDLMDSAIGDGAIVLERTIDVHVKSLRKKLGAAGDYIETVRGVGYRFREAP